jgi:putative transposase
MTSESRLRPTPAPDVLAEAFLWTATRTVTATRSVSLHGNLYDVDPVLVGRRVELRYDPTDLATIAVFVNDEPAGAAVPFELSRHVDPKLKHAGVPEPGEPTGVRYLDALAADHAEQLRGELSYRPTPPPEQEPS